jgi:hypothetical protein
VLTTGVDEWADDFGDLPRSELHHGRRRLIMSEMLDAEFIEALLPSPNPGGWTYLV